MMKHFFAGLLVVGIAGCSGEQTDQEAIDAAVEKALAERDREDAARYRQQSGGESSGDSRERTASSGNSDDDPNKDPNYSTEKLRDGLSKKMGSAYHMCAFTISIVGQHCGCMVNRATDAGIPNAAQVGMFAGDGKRATPAQIRTFTNIVKACSGYEMSIDGSSSGSSSTRADTSISPPAQASSSAGGRVVRCTFDNTVHSYDGQCRFEAGAGGDFKATSLEGPYFQNVDRIDLNVTSRGAGKIKMFYPDGYVETVAVTRSRSDRSCWTGPKMSFCAR